MDILVVKLIVSCGSSILTIFSGHNIIFLIGYVALESRRYLKKCTPKFNCVVYGLNMKGKLGVHLILVTIGNQSGATPTTRCGWRAISCVQRVRFIPK